MSHHVSRRNFLATTATGGVMTSLIKPNQAIANEASTPKFRYCLNSGTIRGQKLPLEQQVGLVAKAGYDGIEPWIRDIEAFVQSGGKLADLKKRISDAGIRVESAIGFAHWIANDPAERKTGLEQAKRDMDLLRQIGGTHLAAPPAGATKGVKLDLLQAAERYRALLEAGADIGVIPQVEVWGHSENLSLLGESIFVAIESGHPDACLLPDVYHLYKGGSPFEGLKMVAGTSIHCFHMNDYPADPPRETIVDADRVYPGDGVAPLNQILQTLAVNSFSGVLSLELFNRTYWQQDAAEVARTGLRKMKDAVAQAFA